MVSNQNLSIEMFLVRLIYLSHITQNSNESLKIDHSNNKSAELKLNEEKTFENKDSNENTNKTVSQIKNIFQEEKSKKINEEKINSFEDLIKICIEKKELNLKYELETNVNLVSFKNQRIEISFNENLNKNFVKDLSLKLFEWTNLRWIIAFSKQNGKPTIKEVDKINKSQMFSSAEKSKIIKKVEEVFPDVELIDIELDKNN